MADKGAFEQLTDIMPYVMAIVLSIAGIVIFIYGIYSFCKTRDGREALISTIYFVNMILVGFVVFAITTILRMDAGEHLSIEQILNLLIATIGIVLFNVLAYIKLTKSKSKEITVLYDDIEEIEKVSENSCESPIQTNLAEIFEKWASTICKTTNQFLNLEDNSFEDLIDKKYISFLIAVLYETQKNCVFIPTYVELSNLVVYFSTNVLSDLFDKESYLKDHGESSLAVKYYDEIDAAKDEIIYDSQLRCLTRITECYSC